MNEKILFHYTSEAGLQGILQNKCLWATNAFASNDSSEIILGQKLLARDLEEWAKQNDREEDDLKFLFDAPAKISKGVFLLCFSTVKNYNEEDKKYILENGLLSQWRGYGSYAIKFKKNDILKGLRKLGLKDGDPIIIGNLDEGVRYLSESEIDYEEFKKCDFINEFKEIIISKEWIGIESKMQSGQKLLESECKKIGELMKLTLIPRFLVKHKSFKEEQEARVVIDVPINCDKTKIHFHAPYKSHIKLFEEYPTIIENAIEEIIIGPVSDKKAAKHWVDSMLREFGYKNVKVKYSEIPFRKS